MNSAQLDAEIERLRRLQRCPTCDSPEPHLHPAVQAEGEVETCQDRFHLRETPENTEAYRQRVLEKRIAKEKTG